MRIYLDESRCDVEAGSVSQALAGAAAEARRRGRAIVDVVVDGQHWPAERLDQRHLNAAAASEIHLTTADCAELVRQAFNDAALALREADRLQQTAAELLQADRAVDAMQRLAEALDIWSNVRAAVLMGAEMAGIDLDDHGDESGDEAESAGATILALGDRLQQVRGALQSRDSVALADILLYDLPEVVAAWRGMLCGLQQRVKD